MIIFNFRGIGPFDSAVWNMSSVKEARDIAIGSGWGFQPDGVVSERDKLRIPPQGLEHSKEFFKSLAVWIRVLGVVECQGWRVAKVVSHSYTELHDLVGPDGGQCQLRIAYNGKNIVTAMHVDDSGLWPLLVEWASECIATASYTSEAMSLLGAARSKLEQTGWKIVSAEETSYRLVTTVVRGTDERVKLEINFDKQGLVTSFRPLTCSKPEVLNALKEAFQ